MHLMQAGVAGSYSTDQLEIRWSASSDVGKRRSINEDSSGVFPGLYVVADGMGGHEAGEVASQLAVQVAERFAPLVPMSLDQVADLVAEANAVVRHHAVSVGPDGMGTTLVGVALIENGTAPALVVFNVGDSRCYELRAGRLDLLTVDHSLVQEMVSEGRLTAHEAEVHPERNVVTRAIGIEDRVAADFIVLEPCSETRLVLCSDGVSGELDHEDLLGVVADAPTPGEVADALIRAVLERPARDNATVVVIDVSWSGLHEGQADLDLDVTGPRTSAPVRATESSPEAVVDERPAETGPTNARPTTNLIGSMPLPPPVAHGEHSPPIAPAQQLIEGLPESWSPSVLAHAVDSESTNESGAVDG